MPSPIRSANSTQTRRKSNRRGKNGLFYRRHKMKSSDYEANARRIRRLIASKVGQVTSNLGQSVTLEIVLSVRLPPVWSSA